MVEVRERRRALDLASVRGKRIVCRVSKVSSARGRGSTPLLVMSMPGSKCQGAACSTHNLMDCVTDMFSGSSFVSLSCSFKKAV